MTQRRAYRCMTPSIWMAALRTLALAEPRSSLAQSMSALTSQPAMPNSVMARAIQLMASLWTCGGRGAGVAAWAPTGSRHMCSSCAPGVQVAATTCGPQSL